MKKFDKLKTSLAAENAAVAPRVNKFALADAVMTPTVEAPAVTAETATDPKKESEGQEIAARMTLSLPQHEADAIEEMRTALAKTGRIASKSELIRAAIMSFKNMSAIEQAESVSGLEKLKPGRKTK